MYYQPGYVYIMTNKNKTVLYVGMTNNLVRRVKEHQAKTNPNCFTARYNCNMLVWYENTSTVVVAIKREKQIKGGSRAKKVALINAMNPGWEDLSQNLLA